MSKEDLFDRIASFLKQNGAKKVAIFGSFARGLENPNSDIDILVEFGERKSLLEIVSIEMKLSEELGIKVDLLTEKSISPYLIDRVKAEMKVVYQ